MLGLTFGFVLYMFSFTDWELRSPVGGHEIVGIIILTSTFVLVVSGFVICYMLNNTAWMTRWVLFIKRFHKVNNSNDSFRLLAT